MTDSRPMTRYRAVAIFPKGVEYREFDNSEQASEYDLAMMAISGMEATRITEIDDSDWIIVYHLQSQNHIEKNRSEAK